MKLTIRVYGIWSHTDKVWIVDDTGRILYFPSQGVAEAQMDCFINNSLPIFDRASLQVRELGIIKVETEQGEE